LTNEISRRLDKINAIPSKCSLPSVDLTLLAANDNFTTTINNNNIQQQQTTTLNNNDNKKQQQNTTTKTNSTTKNTQQQTTNNTQQQQTATTNNNNFFSIMRISSTEATSFILHFTFKCKPMRAESHFFLVQQFSFEWKLKPPRQSYHKEKKTWLDFVALKLVLRFTDSFL